MIGSVLGVSVVGCWKYSGELGLWFDRRMKGSVEFGKMTGEWMRKIEWMSRVKGVG